MPNYSPKTEHLPKQKAAWQHLPTEVLRVPAVFLEEIKAYARSLDGQTSPFEFVISALDKLSKDEIEQIKLAIESLSGSESVEEIQSVQSIPSIPEPQLSDAEIAAYTAKFGFVPSKYQLAIADWILRGKGNGCCNAVAGSGKSSTLRIVAKTLVESGLKSGDIKICVFGKLNAQDLIKKFGPAWKESISTLHSAGFALVKKYLQIKSSYDIDVSNLKYKRIAQDLGLLQSRNNPVGILNSEQLIGSGADFLKLIDLVRLTNQQVITDEVVAAIAHHHEIENVWQPELIAKWIEYCLQIGEEKAIKKECLDFTDQIWLPVKWKLGEKRWFKPYKFVLVDECQDLNAAQLELALILAGNSGRILAVGDPRQAIMGFAGADDQSYNSIVKRTNAIELPLSICYRCPRSHIELVKSIFPQIPIEPASTASEGIINQIEEHEIDRLIKNGDMVIARKTSPLVSLCIKLIGQGIKATVKGKDIGESLKKDLDEIAKVPGYSYQSFNEAVQTYRQIKAQQYRGFDNEEQMLENLKDKIQAIITIYQSQTQATNIEHLKLYIDTLFSDENSPITLCVIHRAKGLEGERIFIHKPDDMPMRWKNQLAWQLTQEENLLYVALTRSKSELFIVGHPSWYSATNNSAKQELNSLKDDYFSLLRKAREQFDIDLAPLFPDKDSRERLINKLTDDAFSLHDLEEAGKIKFTTDENRKAVYTAFNKYWKKFYEAEKLDEIKYEQEPRDFLSQMIYQEENDDF